MEATWQAEIRRVLCLDADEAIDLSRTPSQLGLDSLDLVDLGVRLSLEMPPDVSKSTTRTAWLDRPMRDVLANCKRLGPIARTS